MAATPSTMLPLGTAAADFGLTGAAGRPVAAEQTPSIGCNINWKPGEAPACYATTT